MFNIEAVTSFDLFQLITNILKKNLGFMLTIIKNIICKNILPMEVLGISK